MMFEIGEGDKAVLMRKPQFSFLFFILCILSSSFSVRFSVIGVDLPLVIPPGEDAVLPCHLSPEINAHEMTIRWFKYKYQDLVHLYRDGEDRVENQMAEYRSRTTLIKDGIKAGNVSLIIHNVRYSDSGLYTCFYDSGSFYDEAVVELKVEALGSEPHIYLDKSQNGGIAVVCESSGWYPEPEALWRDEDGNNMSSSTEVKVMDDSLQFHVKAIYIFNGHPNTLSCWVRNPILSQWKQSTLHITDAFFQKMSSCILNRLLISASITALGILFTSWTVYLVNKQKREKKRLPDELDWRRARRFATKVYLDHQTAHSWLVLYKDDSSVREGYAAQPVKYSPHRFTHLRIVLGKETLSSGRHYWEVEVGDKTDWILGVCDESVNRNWKSKLTPEDGFWTVRLRNGIYKALTSSRTILTPRVPPRAVGLFLDYEAGRISVYNVDDRSQLFTFPKVSFPTTLQPLFSPGLNDGEKNGRVMQILQVTGRE
ncbi:butyrophilin subfamily 1 member A1-like [Lissotriton helveticus]